MTARHTPMRCEQFEDELGAYLEREVDESTRASMDTHALACASCGALLADLRQIRAEAANLRELAPARDLWEGIAARIDAPVISISEGRGGPQQDAGPTRTRRAWLGRRMLAAAALVAAAGLGGVMTYALMPRDASTTAPRQVATADTPAATSMRIAPDAGTKPAPASETAATGTATPSVSAVNVAASETRATRPNRGDVTQVAAQATFDLEITRLRAIVRRRSTQMDPVTLSVIERNLKVIDEAIAQCKAALAKDPSSRFLIESLNGAYSNKVELLRTAAMLPART